MRTASSPQKGGRSARPRRPPIPPHQPAAAHQNPPRPAVRKEYNAGIREGHLVSYQPETPFDNIESAQQFVELLAEAIEEARREVEDEIARASRADEERRRQALQLISYNLAKLSAHMATSRRILNDLRSLRRLLLGERLLEKATADSPSEGPSE